MAKNRTCVVKFCRNIGNHCFPKNEIRRAEWISAIKYVKPRLTLKKNTYICSAHFKPTDFSVTPTHMTKANPTKVLKRNATPSVFVYPRKRISPPRTFDPSKVKATYSRTPPIKFVMMPPVIAYTSNIQDVKIEDPLHLSEDETDIEVKVEECQETETNVTKDPTENVHLSEDETDIEVKVEECQETETNVTKDPTENIHLSEDETDIKVKVEESQETETNVTKDLTENVHLSEDETDIEVKVEESQETETNVTKNPTEYVPEEFTTHIS